MNFLFIFGTFYSSKLHYELNMNCTVFKKVLGILPFLLSLYANVVAQSGDFPGFMVAASNPQPFLDYVERYKAIAVSEMERTGVPASIKLAQGLVETNAGRSTIATKAFNHFGIKCGYDWKSDTIMRKDDDYDASGNLKHSCFRKYNSPEQSFVDHSEFLRDPMKRYRYGFLFQLDPHDYKGWAEGLLRAGYETDRSYSNMLISTIERFELFKYDYMSSGTVASNEENSPTIPPLTPNNARIQEVNGLDMVFAQAGDTPASIAARYNVNANKIVKYNERLKSTTTPLKANERIFLERKARYFNGSQDVHRVLPNETMYDIAQQYGIRLYRLYDKNRMIEGTEPAAGELLSLNGYIDKNSPIKLRSSQNNRPNTPNTPSSRPSESVNPYGGKLLDIDTAFEVSIDEEPIKVIPTPTPSLPRMDDEVSTSPMPPSGNNTTPRPRPVPSTTPPPKPIIPSEPTPKPSTPTNNTNNNAKMPVFHTVGDGDTLYNVAKRYNTTVQNIQKLNFMENNVAIKKGQSLRVK